MEPFIVGVDITDVNKLYGRKRQIDILTSCAKGMQASLVHVDLAKHAC